MKKYQHRYHGVARGNNGGNINWRHDVAAASMTSAGVSHGVTAKASRGTSSAAA
jgi:hypothetical protein